MTSVRSESSHSKKKVLILDWDQTVTMRGGGSNEKATHMGFDYISSPEKISQGFLVAGFADALLSALNQGHSVIIGTSQPMQQIIRRALVAHLGERANEITIACGKPENLIFEFSVRGGDELKKRGFVFRVPLHVNEVEKIISEFKAYASEEVKQFVVQNKELDAATIERNWQAFKESLTKELEKRCAVAGISKEWERCYAKPNWEAQDVAHVTALMDRLGIDRVGVIESEKELFLWEELKRRFSDPSECEKIVYVDDSSRRLGGFQKLKPSEFAATEISCITAIPDQNQHLVAALKALEIALLEFPLKKVEELSAEDAKTLIKLLNITPVRLKKFMEGSPTQTFFATPSGTRVLPQTMVRLDDDHYMIVGEIPASVGIGKNSKVKAQTIIKVADDQQSFKVENQGLVKIHFLKNTFGPFEPGWDQVKNEFIDRIKKEAALLARHNGLTEQDIKLQINETEKGIRIYMAMPSLGLALSNSDIQNTLDEKDKMAVFYRALERVERIHQNGEVHLDLTLNNILYDGSTGAVRICDFGHTQLFGVRPSMILNPEVAPPKFSGASDDQMQFGPAYDVYSMGVTMSKWLGFKLLKETKKESTSHLGGGYRDNFSKGGGYPERVAKTVTDGGYKEEGGYSAAMKKPASTEQTGKNPEELFNFKDDTQVNPAVIQLLKQMLHPDPRQRPSVAECKARLAELGFAPTALENKEGVQLKT